MTLRVFFQIILTGIPEGSVLGPIIFSMFINDLLLFIKDVELADFANDFANFTVRNSIEELIKVLEKESKSAIGWSKMNMIVNTDMFQVMIMSCDKKRQTWFKYNSIISSVDQHVSTTCKNASRQLNAISQIRSYIGKKKNKSLLIFLYTLTSGIAC